MSQEKPMPQLPDWEKVIWEQTPYKGVSIYKVDEELDPNNLDYPLYTIMALKIESEAEIPLHKHNRNQEWTETITFPNGGRFEIKDEQKSEEIKTDNPFVIIIKAGEIFGLKNTHSSKPLYFLSRMEPGFTGYGEIEEIKAK